MCDSPAAPLSSLLNILPQAQALGRCELTVYEAGSGPLAEIYMSRLRWLTLTLSGVGPDIAIPLFATPNLTTLCIHSHGKWALNTYDILKRHRKLHQLQRIELNNGFYPLRIAQVLADAPMIHELLVTDRSILDAEALEGIASGRLGHHLSSLRLSGYFTPALAGECLDMIESRQRLVNALVTHVPNWRQMLTGIRLVELRGIRNISRDYEERAAALKALGSTVTFCQ